MPSSENGWLRQVTTPPLSSRQTLPSRSTQQPPLPLSIPTSPSAVKDLISFTGTSYSDGALGFDTGVDTAKLSGIEIGSTGIALQARNSLHGQAPRWIHCTDCRLESGGPESGFPVVKIDDVRGF